MVSVGEDGKIFVFNPDESKILKIIGNNFCNVMHIYISNVNIELKFVLCLLTFHQFGMFMDYVVELSGKASGLEGRYI